MNRCGWFRFWGGIAGVALVWFSGVSFAEAGSGAGEKKAWVVVTREMFEKELAPLAEKRREEGYSVTISTKPVGETLAEMGGRPDFLLLVGDIEEGKEAEPWCVRSNVRELYASCPEDEGKTFASDAMYGDLDGDLVCDVPVGRLPVRTLQELRGVIRKILAYENAEASRASLRLPIYGGSPCYGTFLDSMSTTLLVGSLEKNAAAWLRPWAISADPMHPLCGWPAEQPRVFNEQLRAGGLMAVFMGHGEPHYFYSMEHNGASVRYTREDAAGLERGSVPAPPTVIFACYTGTFNGPENCLAEVLLFTPGGPVAVIGATTNSHPMTNYFSGLSLLGQTNRRHRCIGRLWLDAQNEARGTRDFLMERVLLGAGGDDTSNVDTEKVRRDHILLYALLGDPATALGFPEALESEIRADGKSWRWSAKKPEGALKLYVEFRAEGLKFPEVQVPLEKESAMANLEKANEVFAFTPIAELGVGEAWEGTIEKAGTLRLTAVGGKRIYVAAHKIQVQVAQD